MNQTYSHSRLKTFTDCPRKYRFQYVDKVEIPKRESPDTYLGRAVHRVLQELYKLGADGVVMPRDKALAAYDAEWRKVNLDKMVVTNEYYTVDDYIRLGRQMLECHYERYRPFDAGKLIGAEVRLGFELPGTPFRFSAIVDRIVKRDDGVVEILDYKTSQSVVQVTSPIFVQQMGLYQMAVQANYPGMDRIELAQHFLRHDEIVRRTLTPDDLELLAMQVRDIIVSIYNAIRLDDFPTEEGVHCRWCDWHDVCPAKRHAKQLEDEAAPDYSDAAQLRKLTDEFLEKNEALKALKAEVEALKEELRTAARETAMDKFVGELGEVSVRLKTEEKFITKTADRQAWADLNNVVRQLGLEDYLTVDANALMKEIYLKRRLPEEQHQRLSEFVRTRESGVIRGKLITDDRLDEV